MPRARRPEERTGVRPFHRDLGGAGIPSILLVLVSVSFAGREAAAGEGARYVASMEGGTRVRGNVLRRDGPAATLDGRPLETPKRSVAWILDTTVPPAALPAAFVEFYGGDLLPGRVVAGGEDGGKERLPAHVVVRLSGQASRAERGPPVEVRVATRSVRRIVAGRRGPDRHVPGLVVLRDGEIFRSRAARFEGDGVELLLAEGRREVPLDRIAELHLPQRDPWDVYLEELALLSPSGRAKIVRVETGSGAVITASVERQVFKPARAAGGRSRYQRLVQPAWSIDPLDLDEADVRVELQWWPWELPLTRLEPLRAERRPVFSVGWPARRDRNVYGGVLGAAGRPFAWGIGMHAPSTVEYELPGPARAFRAAVGIDATVGDGGCARARMEAGAAGGRPLFETPLMVGSGEVHETGRLAIRAQEPDSRLRLVVDAVLTDRPTGADPFDIRDAVDWLEPTLLLDRSVVAGEVIARAPRLVEAWRGWRLDHAGESPLVLRNRRRPTAPDGTGFRAGVLPVRGRVVVRRPVRLHTARRSLVISVSREPGTDGESVVIVRSGGVQVAEFAVPARGAFALPEPRRIPIPGRRGEETEVVVIQVPRGQNATVDWHLLSIVPGGVSGGAR